VSRPVPLRAVAALFIERQQLDRPRGRRLTAASVARLADDTGGIQIDTINVLDRAHYLTAWSRFGVFDHATFDRLAYRRRVLFEYWAHAACFVPASQFAIWRRAMMDYEVRHTGWPRFLRKHPKLLAEVEATIRAQGPMANADFEHARPPGASGWWNWKPAMHALHHLWMTGRLLVHSRSHFQKRYDLAERVMGEALALAPPTSDEFLRWHIRRSLHAMGAATEVDLRLYLTFPRVRPATRRRTALAALVRSGEVIEIEVETGRAGRWFLLAEDAPALAAAARRRTPSRGTTFLSPFDSFLWHRDRTRRLFGFDYRIEVYTPGHKRVHGYYSLPIFHDGRLIGRLDAKNHRGEQRLEVRHAHFERWFSDGAPAPAAFAGAPPLDRERALAGIADTLRSLAAFLDAERITMGRVTPNALAAPLRRQLTLAKAEAGREASSVTT
jgi:uncharacterized protein YcaQ